MLRRGFTRELAFLQKRRRGLKKTDDRRSESEEQNVKLHRPSRLVQAVIIQCFALSLSYSYPCSCARCDGIEGKSKRARARLRVGIYIGIQVS